MMAPASLLNGAGMQLPTLLLAGLYGPTVAGWYFATQRLLGLPVQLIGTAAGQAFLGEAATLVDDDPQRLSNLFDAVTKRLILLGLVPTIFLIAFGPWGMETLLGQEWRESGVYLQWLAGSFLLKFGFDELINLAMARRNDYALAWAALRLALACGAVVFAHAMKWPAVRCIALLSGALAIGYLVKLWLWKRALNRLKVQA
jgi:O-antigen/teichoic acid export membrane protein